MAAAPRTALRGGAVYRNVEITDLSKLKRRFQGGGAGEARPGRARSGCTAPLRRQRRVLDRRSLPSRRPPFTTAQLTGRAVPAGGSGLLFRRSSR